MMESSIEAVPQFIPVVKVEPSDVKNEHENAHSKRPSSLLMGLLTGPLSQYTRKSITRPTPTLPDGTEVRTSLCETNNVDIAGNQKDIPVIKEEPEATTVSQPWIKVEVDSDLKHSPQCMLPDEMCQGKCMDRVIVPQSVEINGTVTKWVVHIQPSNHGADTELVPLSDMSVSEPSTHRERQLISLKSKTKPSRKRATKSLHKCPVCDKEFTLSSNLTTHRRTHTGERPYKCTVCGKGFTQLGHLTAHKRTHTAERPYLCTVCGRGFTQSVSLKAHLRTHTGEKPYKCTVCDKSYKTGGQLTAHNRSHTGEKPYQCTICGKCFARSNRLVRHRRTHTAEKPFKCSICGKAYATKNYLGIHQRIHTGERPYKCAVCGKGFIYKGEFNHHQLRHTGEKPYKCTVCGKGFTRKVYVTKHNCKRPGEKLNTRTSIKRSRETIITMPSKKL